MWAEREAERGGESRWTEAPDGIRLHYLAWEANRPRASVVIVPGLGDHGGRYEWIARRLQRHGYSAHAIDLRGHGRSEGQRGHSDRFDRLVDDVHAVRTAAAGAEPTFLLGHSLGGLVALRYAQGAHGRSLRGAVVSAPALAVAVEAPAWKAPAALALARVLPRLPLTNEIDPRALSRDAEVVQAYRNDSLVHDRITPRFYAEMMGAMRRAVEQHDRLRLPLLILVPGDDRVVRSEATLALAGRLSEHAEVRRYPDSYHEPLNDPRREEVWHDLAAWLDGLARPEEDR